MILKILDDISHLHIYFLVVCQVSNLEHWNFWGLCTQKIIPPGECNWTVGVTEKGVWLNSEHNLFCFFNGSKGHRLESLSRHELKSLTDCQNVSNMLVRKLHHRKFMPTMPINGYIDMPICQLFFNVGMCMSLTIINQLKRSILAYAEILVKILLHLAEILSFWTETIIVGPSVHSWTLKFVASSYWTLLSNFDFLHYPQFLQWLNNRGGGIWPDVECLCWSGWHWRTISNPPWNVLKIHLSFVEIWWRYWIVELQAPSKKINCLLLVAKKCNMLGKKT